MPNYHVRISFKSDRHLEQIEKYFGMVIKGLKLDREPRMVIEVRSPSGPEATQYKNVERWIKRRTRQEGFTSAEVADGLNMNRSTAWKNLEKLQRDGVITSEMILVRGVSRRVYSKVRAADRE